MSSDDHAYRPDVAFRQAGVGMSSNRLFTCYGCDRPRPTLGSKGAHGIGRRCAACVAAKAAKAAAA